MESNYWDDQLKKFREAKKKSVTTEELLHISENILTKLKNTQLELEKEKTSHAAEILALKNENKNLRDELDEAWKNN